MAVQEHSLWILYTAVETTTIRGCPPHLVYVTAMDYPWRRGRAVVLPLFWSRKVLILGIWRKPRGIVAADLEEERWLDPKWLGNGPDEIAEWGLDEPEDETEGEEAPSRS